MGESHGVAAGDFAGATAYAQDADPAYRREAIQALDAVLALNGITMINVSDKFVKALPEAQGNTAGAPFHTNVVATIPELVSILPRGAVEICEAY